MTIETSKSLLANIHTKLGYRSFRDFLDDFTSDEYAEKHQQAHASFLGTGNPVYLSEFVTGYVKTHPEDTPAVTALQKGFRSALVMYNLHTMPVRQAEAIQEAFPGAYASWRNGTAFPGTAATRRLSVMGHTLDDDQPARKAYKPTYVRDVEAKPARAAKAVPQSSKTKKVVKKPSKAIKVLPVKKLPEQKAFNIESLPPFAARDTFMKAYTQSMPNGSEPVEDVLRSEGFKVLAHLFPRTLTIDVSAKMEHSPSITVGFLEQYSVTIARGGIKYAFVHGDIDCSFSVPDTSYAEGGLKMLHIFDILSDDAIKNVLREAGYGDTEFMVGVIDPTPIELHYSAWPDASCLHSGTKGNYVVFDEENCKLSEVLRSTYKETRGVAFEGSNIDVECSSYSLVNIGEDKYVCDDDYRPNSKDVENCGIHVEKTAAGEIWTLFGNDRHVKILFPSF